MLDLFGEDLIKEYTVSEISKEIKKLLEGKFQYIKVVGEITNYKKSSLGHIYLSLKDENSMISVVLFRQYASHLNFNLEDGMRVVVSGKITIYPQRSTYQLMAENIKVSGKGELIKIIEKRKVKLQSEGLFDVSRKKPIPEFIEKAGIITSSTGAGIHDIYSRLDDRLPIDIALYHATVQGVKASKEIIKGIRYFNNLPKKQQPNVIIITRGGGSMEDLMCFNDEELVREVFKSSIPTISAVGHEIDYTLIDYVSDLRLPTPTSVAEVIAKSKYELRNNLNFVFDKINTILKAKISSVDKIFLYFDEKIKSFIFLLNNKKESLEVLDKIFLNNLKNFVQMKYNFYQEKIEGVNFKSFYQKINSVEKDLDLLSKNLELYDYKKILTKGYSVVKKDGKFIKDVSSLKVGELITIELSNGEKLVKVIK